MDLATLTRHAVDEAVLGGMVWCSSVFAPSTMQDPDTFSGRVVEIRRFVIPLEPYAPTANRERWDLWLQTSNGGERQFIITCRSMPARRGHHVVLAMDRDTPIGIVNVTTRVRLNFARSTPPAILQPSDVVIPVVLLFGAMFFAAMADASGVLLLAVPLAVLYVPILVGARRLTNAATATRAEDTLDRIERELGGSSGRRP